MTTHSFGIVYFLLIFHSEASVETELDFVGGCKAG